MRKLILEEWLSLDGHVADASGGLNFFTDLTPEQNTYSDRDQLKFLERVDTILLGRKTYELFVDFWPSATVDKEVIADRLNSTRKVVFSNSLTAAPWPGWADAEIASGDAVAAVRKMKAASGQDMVLWGSISLAQALMAADLIDEYHIQLCPVLTGGGRRLFPASDAVKNLHLSEIRHYGTGVVFLNYVRVKKSDQ